MPRWNKWTRVQPVQLENETTPTPRPVRLSGPSVRKGARVRISVGDVEVEGTVIESAYSVLHVRLEHKSSRS